MRQLVFSALFFALLIVGCSDDRVVYNQIHDLPDARWSYGESYDYNIVVDDIEKQYRLLLYLEFATDYQWQNLYTRISTTLPSDTVLQDIVSLEMANKVGQWYGDCSAKNCELTIVLQEPIRFEQVGEHRFQFEQQMREETIDGIQRIGLRLVELPTE